MSDNYGRSYQNPRSDDTGYDQSQSRDFKSKSMDDRQGSGDRTSDTQSGGRGQGGDTQGYGGGAYGGGDQYGGPTQTDDATGGGTQWRGSGTGAQSNDDDSNAPYGQQQGSYASGGNTQPGNYGDGGGGYGSQDQGYQGQGQGQQQRRSSGGGGIMHKAKEMLHDIKDTGKGRRGGSGGDYSKPGNEGDY